MSKSLFSWSTKQLASGAGALVLVLGIGAVSFNAGEVVGRADGKKVNSDARDIFASLNTAKPKPKGSSVVDKAVAAAAPRGAGQADVAEARNLEMFNSELPLIDRPDAADCARNLRWKEGSDSRHGLRRLGNNISDYDDIEGDQYAVAFFKNAKVTGLFRPYQGGITGILRPRGCDSFLTIWARRDESDLQNLLKQAYFSEKPLGGYGTVGYTTEGQYRRHSLEKVDFHIGLYQHEIDQVLALD